MMKKFPKPFVLLAVAPFLLLTGCAQKGAVSAQSEPSVAEDETPVVPEGVRKVARFAVKQVVSKPVKVAMTVGEVAQKVKERKESQEEPSL
jgi:hypothetical protein